MLLERDSPGLADLIRITRPDGVHAWNAAQARELLDGLVRRPVLADTNGIMREYPNHRHFHDGREPDGAAHVIGEDQETGAERTQLRQRHSVAHRPHRVLAD